MATDILAPPAAAGILRRLPDATRSPIGTWVLGTGPNRELVTVDFEDLMASHAAVEGSTGTGKTELLKALIDACGGWQGAVILDCTASPHLRKYAESKSYVDVWSLDGPSVYNPFSGSPAQVAARLTDAEEWVQAAEVYRAGAEISLAAAIAALDAEHRPRTPATIIQAAQGLEASGTTLKGIDGIVDRMATVGLAGGQWLSSEGLTCPGRTVEETVRRGRVLLLSLDALTRPRAAQRAGAWIILDVQRAAASLAGTWPFIFAVDEAAKLDKAARHLRTCVAQLRQFGCGTVILTQGEADFTSIGDTAARQVLQNVGIRIGLRQQSEEDQRLWSNRVLKRMHPSQFRQLHDLEGVLLQYARRTDERMVRFRMQPRTAVPLRTSTAVRPSGRFSAWPWWRRQLPPAQPSGELAPMPDWLDDPIGRRFWKHTKAPVLAEREACWESTYAPDTGGYARISIDGKDVRAHVFAKARADGRDLAEILELTKAGRLTVDHMCKNRLCWRDTHTQWKLLADHASLEWERRRLAKDGITAEGL